MTYSVAHSFSEFRLFGYWVVCNQTRDGQGHEVVINFLKVKRGFEVDFFNECVLVFYGPYFLPEHDLNIKRVFET